MTAPPATGAHCASPVEQRVLRMLRRHGLWQRLPALRVLDVGCGNGQWLVGL